MADTTDTGTASGTDENNPSNQRNSSDIQDIDLDALAEEILSLFKRELQIERERLGWY